MDNLCLVRDKFIIMTFSLNFTRVKTATKILQEAKHLIV